MSRQTRSCVPWEIRFGIKLIKGQRKKEGCKRRRKYFEECLCYFCQGHYYTWTTGEKELSKGIDLCPGVNIQNVTTTDIRWGFKSSQSFLTVHYVFRSIVALHSFRLKLEYFSSFHPCLCLCNFILPFNTISPNIFSVIFLW